MGRPLPMLLRSRLHRPRIGPTLALVFGATATVTTLATGALVVQSSMSIAHHNTSQRLHDGAELIAEQLDGEAIANLRDPSQRLSPVYLQTHKTLTSGLQHIRGVRFIYTLRKAKEPIKDPFSRYEFVVDGTPFNSKDFSMIGEIMPTSSSTDALHRVWKTGKFEADRSFVKDSWGTWLSGYVPLRRRDGSFDTVLGIDISAEQVLADRNRILSKLAQAYLISLLITLPLAALLGRQISEPLRYVHQRLQAIAQLHLNAKASKRGSSDFIYEIHQILSSLGTVQAALSEFTTYVPTTLVRQLVLNSSSLDLRGEMRHLAIMFTDIRNFTGLCESLEPGEMLKLLNQYFAVINEEASATQGVLDKYIGDSALLFWGAPEPIDQPAQACIEAAIRCRERLDVLNERWQQEGIGASFHTTFGIDYGSVVVGNIGPRERVNFTIIGERVNLAQRLEHSNRLYGTRILASADLVQALGPSSADYLIVKVADTTLRGFSHPMEIFEVIGRRDHANAMEVRFSDTLNAAQEARLHNRLGEALALLHSLPASLAERPYVQELIHSCNGGLG